MNKYLEKIIQHKYREVEERKALYPIKLLEKSVYFQTQPVSMKAYLRRPDKSGVIAEFKRKSPSKGWINQFANVADVTLGYMQAAASGLSVLTDSRFFAGSFDDLKAARNENYCPILQKDFIVDEYQLIEAKSIGADTVLLIAAVLDKKQMKNLSEVAHKLGLETLVEIHSTDELDKIPLDTDVVGINNRNLHTFEVDIENSEKLLNLLPKEMVKIAESGIKNAEDGVKLKRMGFDGLLIGEQFMATIDPALACKRFIRKMENISDG
jgi:indole-3-glycerol phosphate synthase